MFKPPHCRVYLLRFWGEDPDYPAVWRFILEDRTAARAEALAIFQRWWPFWKRR
jgi:hypothetical protein